MFSYILFYVLMLLCCSIRKCRQGAQLRLDDELRKGHVQVDQWLKKNSLPRLPLPNVCGYIPLVASLADALRDKSQRKVSAAVSPSGVGDFSASRQLWSRKYIYIIWQIICEVESIEGVRWTCRIFLRPRMIKLVIEIRCSSVISHLVCSVTAREINEFFLFYYYLSRTLRKYLLTWWWVIIFIDYPSY